MSNPTEQDNTAIGITRTKIAKIMLAKEYEDLDSDEIPATDRMYQLIQQHTEAACREARREGFGFGVYAFSNYFMDASIRSQRTPIMPDVARELVEGYKDPIKIKVKGD